MNNSNKMEINESSSQPPKIEEKESKLSFFQLFKYAKISDKIMIVFGIIFSIILGFCMPNM